MNDDKDFTIPLAVVRLVRDRDCYSLSAVGYMHPLAFKPHDKEVQILESIRPSDVDYGKALAEAVETATSWVELKMADVAVILYHDKHEGTGAKPEILGYVVPTSDKVIRKLSAKKIIKAHYQLRDFQP